MSEITSQEMDAARQLGEALLRLMLAVQSGDDARRAAREPPRPHAPPPPPPTPAPLASAAPSRLLTLREAADRLAVSDRHLWGLTIPRGSIPVVRMGRAHRYTTEDIDAAIDRLKRKPASEKQGREST